MKSRRLLTKALLSTVAACALGGSAIAAEPAELRESALDYFEAIPSMVPAIEGNAVTREKVEPGKNRPLQGRDRHGRTQA